MNLTNVNLLNKIGFKIVPEVYKRMIKTRVEVKGSQAIIPRNFLEINLYGNPVCSFDTGLVVNMVNR